MWVGYSLEDISRKSPEYIQFVNSVLLRDGNKCKFCNSLKDICVHHLYPYAKIKTLQIDPSNGVAVCIDCHGVIHGRRFKRND